MFCLGLYNYFITRFNIIAVAFITIISLFFFFISFIISFLHCFLITFSLLYSGPILESACVPFFRKRAKRGQNIWKFRQNLKIFWKRVAVCVRLSHVWNSWNMSCYYYWLFNYYYYNFFCSLYMNIMYASRALARKNRFELQPLTIITKSSTLGVAAVLDPPLFKLCRTCTHFS